MNMIQRLRLLSHPECGLPCVVISDTALAGQVNSLVGLMRRIYTNQPQAHLLVTAPSLTPGQRYSEHPVGLVLVDGSDIHIERIYSLLDASHQFNVEDMLKLAGLEDATLEQGCVRGRWYPLEWHLSEGGGQLVLITPEKHYTLLKQMRSAEGPSLWTLDSTLADDQASGLFKEHPCSDAPRLPTPPPLPQPKPLLFRGESAAYKQTATP